VFAPFGSKGLLKQEDIDQFLKDLRWLLIEADVSLPVVNELVERLREKTKTSNWHRFASGLPSKDCL